MEKLKIEERKRIVEIEDDDIKDTDQDLKFLVACKIMSNKTVNEEFFSSMMPRI